MLAQKTDCQDKSDDQTSVNSSLRHASEISDLLADLSSSVTSETLDNTVLETSNLSDCGELPIASSSHLTNQDLAALENIQAELDKLGTLSNNIDEISDIIAPDSGSITSTANLIANNVKNSILESPMKIECPVKIENVNLPCTLNQIIPVATSTPLTENPSKIVQTLVKRPILNQSNQIPKVTKVIITSNPLTNQPTAHPVTTVSNQGNILTTVIPATTISQCRGSLTPTKTITVSKASMVQPGKSHFITTTTMPGTPPKQGMVINKIAISPIKTPTKITMIPVTVAKTPQRIAPAPVTTLVTMVPNAKLVTATATKTITTLTNAAGKQTTVQLSPSKVFIKQPILTTSKSGTTQGLTNATLKQVTLPINSPNVQQIQVPGSKFHYVRLVTTPLSVSNATNTVKSVMTTQIGKPLAPATIAVTTSTQHTTTVTPTQVKIAFPIAPAQQSVASKPTLGSQQRILIPATNIQQIRPVPQTVTQLPPGTTLISTGNNMQSLALVPAHYIAQLQQQLAQQQNQTIVQSSLSTTTAQSSHQSSYVPLTSFDHPVSSSKHNGNRSSIEANGVRPRKPCNCTKSQCLKLYCDCFANGEFCNSCNCSACSNNLEHEEERSKAIKACLERNPQAFYPKIGKGKEGEPERRHNKGCNCKRSGCLKNYCECYEAKIMCSASCKCVGCKNFEENPERKILMHLADAAEVRIQQQTAAKSKLSSQIQDIPTRPPTMTLTGERLPFSFITKEVVEATCQCLLAQAEEAEKLHHSDDIIERLILKEFGRCLMQIIHSANKTKVPSPDS